ncbi:hypothetical protein QIS74_09343 [Colletotrichum tabaci]|uniref:Uncharacterized protein n=1 Tax=Colletotrichum tabaci TaxID=1209068 RepID=A0AAV9T491_9PEZI
MSSMKTKGTLAYIDKQIATNRNEMVEIQEEISSLQILFEEKAKFRASLFAKKRNLQKVTTATKTLLGLDIDMATNRFLTEMGQKLLTPKEEEEK